MFAPHPPRSNKPTKIFERRIYASRPPTIYASQPPPPPPPLPDTIYAYQSPPPPPPLPDTIHASPVFIRKQPPGNIVPNTEKVELMGGKYSKNVYKKVGKKEVLGKDRVIYKMKGSNKEYLKTKGMYIPVSEYKKLKK